MNEKVLAGIMIAVILIFIAWTYAMSVSDYTLSTNAVSDVPIPNSYSEPPENKQVRQFILSIYKCKDGQITDIQRDIAETFMNITHTATHLMDYACHISELAYFDKNTYPNQGINFHLALQKPDIKQRKYEDVAQMLGIVPTSSVSVNDAYYISSDKALLGIYTWMDSGVFLKYLHMLAHRYPFNTIEDILVYATKQFDGQLKVHKVYVDLGFLQGYGEFQHFALSLGIRQNGMVCSKENRDIAENIATIVGINVDKVVPTYKCYGDSREFDATYVWKGSQLDVMLLSDELILRYHR